MSHQLLADMQKDAFEFVLKSSSIEVVCTVKNIAIKFGRDFEQTLAYTPPHIERAVISQMRKSGCIGEYFWGSKKILISEKEDDFRSDAEKLEQAGIALYGSRWQTELAASLKNADGKPLDARRIRQWLAGDYATPEWVWPQIKQLAEHRKQQIDELIGKL